MKTTVSEEKQIEFPRLVKNTETGSVAIQTSANRLVVIHSTRSSLGQTVTTGLHTWKPFHGSVTIEG